MQDGLLTEGSFKKIRHALADKYAATRDSLYEQVEKVEAEATAAAIGGAGATGAPSASGLSPAFRALLPPGLPVDPELTFGECGGDSLEAVAFMGRLSAAGVSLTLANLHEYPLSHLSELYEVATACAGGAGKVGCAAVFVPPPVVKAVDWDVEMSLPAQWLSNALDLKAKRAAARATPGTGVFITGVTGFLGPLLVAETLAAAPAGAPVYCLVRCSSPEDGERRLSADAKRAGVMPFLSVPASERTAEAAALAARVKVLQGNVSAPRFGLTADQWNEVVGGVGLVIHSAAKVDMLLPYSCLKAANVTAVLTATTLAISAGSRFMFVSSVGALHPEGTGAGTSVPLAAAGGAGASEGAEKTSTAPLTVAGDGWRRLSGQMLERKSGYGATKAVAEALVVAASSATGLDVQIVRPSAICAASGTGYANSRDATNLLLAVIVATGLAPAKSTLPMRWIPADFVASATVRLAFAPMPSSSIAAYNLLGDGPLLQSAVAVLRTQGFTITDTTVSLWRAAVPGAIPDKHPARPLLPAFLSMNLGADVAVDVDLPIQGAEAALAAIGIAWPAPVSGAAIAKQVAWLHEHGFFAPAAADGKAVVTTTVSAAADP